ncbi:MAG: hypothetical protein AAFO63_00335 [Pseudomonadota bacterium]
MNRLNDSNLGVSAKSGGQRVSLKRIRASLSYRVAKHSFRIFESGKNTFHRVAGTTPAGTLLIFGCQRSGTTHLERLLRADPRTVVFGEFSALSFDKGKTVWRPLPEVAASLTTAEGKLVVARSLLASHQAQAALSTMPGSRAVWMFREAKPVVASMMRKWGVQFERISRRVESDSSGAWELDDFWQQLHDEAGKLSTSVQGTDDYTRDLYALFWLRRNDHFFAQGLDTDPRVLLFDYQTMVSQPRALITACLQATGLHASRFIFPLNTRSGSLRADTSQGFSPKIELLCDAQYARLISHMSPIKK